MRLLLATREGIALWSEARGLDVRLPGARVGALARVGPGSSRIYAASETLVFRSDDEGRTWRPTRAAFPGYSISSLAVHPGEPDVLLAGLETSALFRSEDGGESWAELTSIREMSEEPRNGWHVPWGPAKGHVRTPAWDRRDPRRIYLPIEVGGVVRTEDGGATWENVHGSIHDDVHALAVHPEQHRALYAATRTGFGRSEDFGRTWTAFDGPAHRYIRTIAIDAGNPERVYTAGASSPPGPWQSRPTGAETALFRSDNGGRTWSRLQGGLPPTFAPYIDALVTDPGTPNAVAFATNAGEIYTSRDAGETWQKRFHAPPVARMLVL
jgi:photosystem II stability/assembly factor-like uncharacterized protein